MPLATARLTRLALLLVAAIATGASAQNAPPGDDPGDQPKSFSWGLGLAGLTQQQPYIGIDRENHAIPVIFFENSWVQLMGPFLELKAPSLKWGDEKELTFGVGAQLFGFNGYEPDDAPILNGMAERKSGIFAGPFVKWSSPLVNVTAQWMLDASRKSKGQRVSLGLERSFHVGQHFMLTPSTTATWMDGKYADYYFGVRSDEARAGRPAYVAESTLNAEVGLRIDYLIDQRHSVFAALQYNVLGSAITKSPLVDRSSEQGILLGYLFRFR